MKNKYAPDQSFRVESKCRSQRACFCRRTCILAVIALQIADCRRGLHLQMQASLISIAAVISQPRNKERHQFTSAACADRTVESQPPLHFLSLDSPSRFLSPPRPYFSHNSSASTNCWRPSSPAKPIFLIFLKSNFFLIL